MVYNDIKFIFQYEKIYKGEILNQIENFVIKNNFSINVLDNLKEKLSDRNFFCFFKYDNSEKGNIIKVSFVDI